MQTTSLEKMEFDIEKIKVKKIYESKDVENYTEAVVDCENTRKIYGQLKFGKLHEDRPYTFTSLVTSIDGRIAFSDDMKGPLIAQKNEKDPDGAVTDWWILNMLRAASDGIIIGARTMQAEPEFTGHIFDEQLEKQRIDSGIYPVPYNIITSLDATDIPFDHRLFKEKEIPVMISTSRKGAALVKNEFRGEYIIIDSINGEEDITDEVINLIKNANGKVPVIATEENIPDTKLVFSLLKKIGIDKLLVETPSFTHHLIENKLMDELYFNYSCLYLGGKALTIGQYGKEFSSTNHPHTQMLTMHSHSDHFFYFRHKFVY